MNAARPHTDGVYSDTPTESMVTLAAKLEQVGHVSPDIQMTREEGNRRAREIARATPDEKFDHALSAYLMTRDEVPTWRDRLAVLWPRISHAFVALCIIILTAVVLIVGCAITAKAVDVPPWVLRCIASQENGVHWNDTGDIDGKWTRGSTGAVGPWHISLDVLSDLKLSAHADRLHRDPIYAESITRLWLLRLHSVTGCWHQTCAAWQAGLRGRHRAWARAYAERAFNYGTTY